MEFGKLLINDTITLKEALKKMDAGGEKILFVVEKDSFLKGVITDGDIRRYFLSHGTLDTLISRIYNSNPLYVIAGADMDDIREKMTENKVEVLPVIDENGRVVDAVLWTEIFDDKEKSVKIREIKTPCVIMAGGKGKRLDPFTRILPKPLIPVGEKPVLEYIIDKFRVYGVMDFYVTLNHKSDMVKIYFDSIDKNYNISYICEEEFLGTAGSLKLLPGDMDDTMIVSNCDIVVDADYADLLEFHHRNKNMLTVVGSIQHHKVPYGIIHFANKGKIKNVEEKPELDFTINTGVYVLEKRAIENIPEGKRFDMTDLIDVLIAEDKNVGVYPVSEKSYTDIGQWEEYKKHFGKLI